MSKILGFIQLTLIASEEEGGYASVCPELGIASQGETVDEALVNLKDATLVFLNTIEQIGERERVFRERGIRIYHQKPRGPKTLKLEPSQVGAVFVPPIRSLPRGRKSALVRA